MSFFVNVNYNCLMNNCFKLSKVISVMISVNEGPYKDDLAE